MRGLLGLRGWWWRLYRPGRCVICGKVLPDDNTKGICATERCESQDWDNAQWY